MNHRFGLSFSLLAAIAQSNAELTHIEDHRISAPKEAELRAEKNKVKFKKYHQRAFQRAPKNLIRPGRPRG